MFAPVVYYLVASVVLCLLLFVMGIVLCLLAVGLSLSSMFFLVVVVPCFFFLVFFFFNDTGTPEVLHPSLTEVFSILTPRR